MKPTRDTQSATGRSLPVRFLLVDDHETVRRGLEEILIEEYPDAIVACAATLPQARELIAQKPWDLAIVDINLPGGNGLELLGEIKRNRPHIAALVLSSYPEEEFAVR